MAKLEDLIRQRQLVASHLAWLDNEIAAQGGQGACPPPATSETAATAPTSTWPVPAQGHAHSPSPAQLLSETTHRHAALGRTGSPAPLPEPLGPELQADPVAKELIEGYKSEAQNSPQDARRGCLTLFFIVLGTLVGTLVAVWLLKYR